MNQPRDTAWWNRQSLTVEGKNHRIFHFEMLRRLREARNWVEVEELRDDNALMIERLPLATRKDVTQAIVLRLKELRHG